MEKDKNLFAIHIRTMNIHSILQRSSVQILRKSSYGTGFLFRYEGMNFLCTNKHIISGMQHEYDFEIKSDVACVFCGFAQGVSNSLKKENPYPNYKRVVYSPKDMIWSYSETFDLAVGLFPSSFDYTAPNCDIFIFPYISKWRDTGFFWHNLEVADEVVLFGFPRAIFKTDGIPLSFMRKGYISRLFNSDLDLGKFKFTIIIDGMTMPGMSGSPVFRIKHLNDKDSNCDQVILGASIRFLGLINQSLYDEVTFQNTKILLNDNFTIVQPANEIGNLAQNLIEKIKKDKDLDFKPSRNTGFRNQFVDFKV